MLVKNILAVETVYLTHTYNAILEAKQQNKIILFFFSLRGSLRMLKGMGEKGQRE